MISMVQSKILLITCLFLSMFMSQHSNAQDQRRDIKIRVSLEEKVPIDSIISLTYFDLSNDQDGDLDKDGGFFLFKQVKLGNKYKYKLTFINSNGMEERRAVERTIPLNYDDNEILLNFKPVHRWYEIRPRIVNKYGNGIPDTKITIGINELDTVIYTNLFGYAQALKIPEFDIRAGQQIELKVEKERFQTRFINNAEFNNEFNYSTEIELEREAHISGMFQFSNSDTIEQIIVSLQRLGVYEAPRLDSIDRYGSQFYFSLADVELSELKEGTFILKFTDIHGKELDVESTREYNKFKKSFAFPDQPFLGDFTFFKQNPPSKKKTKDSKFYNRYIKLVDDIHQTRLSVGSELRQNSGIDGESPKYTINLALQHEFPIWREKDKVIIVGGGWNSPFSIEIPSSMRFISGYEQSFDPVTYKRTNFGQFTAGFGDALIGKTKIAIYGLTIAELNRWKASSFVIEEGDLSSEIPEDVNWVLNFSFRLNAFFPLANSRFSLNPYISYSLNEVSFKSPTYQFDLFGQANRQADSNVSFREGFGVGFSLSYQLKAHEK